MTILQESIFNNIFIATTSTRKNIITIPAGTVFYNAPKTAKTAGDKITFIITFIKQEAIK